MKHYSLIKAAVCLDNKAFKAKLFRPICIPYDVHGCSLFQHYAHMSRSFHKSEIFARG